MPAASAIVRHITFPGTARREMTLLLASACATRPVVVASPQPAVHASEVEPLGIPPGHLPPPGKCRVWIRGRPPGHQPPPADCDRILAAAPAGALILHRPERGLVRVRYLDERKPGVVIRVRVFEAETGKFLREERG